MDTPQKPTIPQVVAAFAAYRTANPTWGALHIVLDDGNVRNDDVTFCVRSAEERGDADGARLGRLLLTMSKTQRLKLPGAVKAYLRAAQATPGGAPARATTARPSPHGGTGLTPDAVAQLHDLLDRFERDGIAWDGGEPIRITPETKLAARALFQGLPPSVRAPRIAPDGEGALLAVWDATEGDADASGGVLLTVEGWCLHLVVGAGTDSARHVDAVPFTEGSIPDLVRAHLPAHGTKEDA